MRWCRDCSSGRAQGVIRTGSRIQRFSRSGGRRGRRACLLRFSVAFMVPTTTNHRVGSRSGRLCRPAVGRARIEGEAGGAKCLTPTISMRCPLGWAKWAVSTSRAVPRRRSVREIKSNGVWSVSFVRFMVFTTRVFQLRASEPSARMGALVVACLRQLRMELSVRILVEIQLQRDGHDECTFDQPRLRMLGPADTRMLGHPH